jgi:hypothetical protein
MTSQLRCDAATHNGVTCAFQREYGVLSRITARHGTLSRRALGDTRNTTRLCQPFGLCLNCPRESNAASAAGSALLRSKVTEPTASVTLA